MSDAQHTHHLERIYDASAPEVWELWTTAAGIEAWWAPDGFTTDVRTLDLRPGGELVYVMTATAPEQVEFVPGTDPYEYLTVVDLGPDGDGVRVHLAVADLHDPTWTERLLAGRANELDNLAQVIARRRAPR